jgi:DNA-binding MarR family transcriptional regulator
LSNANAPILTPIQAKILLAMLRAKDHSLNSEAILRETGIALSTWSAEQGKLVEMGIIEKRLVRVLTNDNISKRMNYKLTESGVAIALNLSNISKILSGTRYGGRIAGKPAEDFDERIRECVEIGLESFGANLVTLVKTALESEKGVPWSRIPENPDRLLLVCREFFGEEASKKLETVISANIISRFALGSVQAKDLSSMISSARRSFSTNGAGNLEENHEKLGVRGSRN